MSFKTSILAKNWGL